ncbi:MAG: PLP-dependent aspartate aminotransferase family protein [Ruminococcus sp.]|jgi:cystathionine beta-lyase|nr:PLP-dependent aspartate aminotransferase family protein [Ruminococcus sp.]
MRNIETALIHGKNHELTDIHTGAVNVPIYQTATYRQRALGDFDWEYSRTGNPTRAALESLIATLESGIAGFAFASGMAAITTILQLFKSGDTVIIGTNVYGGTFRVLDKVFKNFGLNYKIVDTANLTIVKEALTPDVKAILIETPANPLLTVTDIDGIADLAKSKGVLTIVDNTFMTPYLQRPIELGADIVVHSATKYLGGHSDIVGGLAVVNSQELADKLAFLQKSTGGILQPFDSYLLIRSIKTLGVRLDRHVANAEAIHDVLNENTAVSKIYYPKNNLIQKKQAKNGGAMLSFELNPNYDIRKFFKGLNLISLAESLGGVESLVCHPASMTHASIPKEIRDKVGITDGLIRLSVGIENTDDIAADLLSALQEARM